MRITTGKRYTAGFAANHDFHGLVCTRTRHEYGFGGYRCGVGKMYPRYTRAEPYLECQLSCETVKDSPSLGVDVVIASDESSGLC